MGRAKDGRAKDGRPTVENESGNARKFQKFKKSETLLGSRTANAFPRGARGNARGSPLSKFGSKFKKFKILAKHQSLEKNSLKQSSVLAQSSLFR